MLNIVTPILTKCKSYDLAYGEAWEQALADALKTQGLNAYRPRQRFIDPKVCKDTIGHWEARIRDAKRPQDVKRYQCHLESEISAYTVKETLRPWQLDLIIRDGRQRLHVELKTLCPEAFRADYIHIGQCQKFDQKLKGVPFHYRTPHRETRESTLRTGYGVGFDRLVLINESTGESWLVPGFWSGHWEVRPNLLGKTETVLFANGTTIDRPILDYAVPRESLVELNPLKHFS